MTAVVVPSESLPGRISALVRRSRGIVAIVVLFLVVVSVLDWYGVLGLQDQYHTPLVVDVTSRQRAFVERYIKDVMLKLDGAGADPNEDASALTTAAHGLLYGGRVPSPQGNVNDLVRVPRPSNLFVRIKLTHEQNLIRQLIAEGQALLREGKSAPSFSADLRALRIKGAQLSSVTGDAAGEEAIAARGDLARLVRVQLTLGALGAFAALGMALLLWRSAKRQSARFRSLVHNASDLITVVDERARITYQSPSSVRVLGYEPDELGLTSLTELAHPDDQPEIERTLAELGAQPDGMVTLRFRLRHRNGAWLTMEGTVHNLVADRSVGGFVINSRDVTERVRSAEELALARDQAMEASRLKSQFLASMSHEIRTPMNAVIGLNELLLGTDLDREQHEYAAGVGSAADGLLAIINDILDFSKVEAGKLELESIDFDVALLLEDVVALVADSAHMKGLELLAHPDPGLRTGVRGDPTRLRQVLINLVSNAVKFTSVGEVVLRAKPVSDDSRTTVVRFEVTDTGLGIAPDDQVRLFEPFSQADSSTTRRFGGTGLGLAIARQLVELMGGQLGLESEVDRGSTFWFELPLDHGDSADLPWAAAPTFSNMSSIIVDDNATNRLILRQQLASWGLQPDEAADASSALDQIRVAAASGDNYAFAILDLNMPDMDGLDLARALKNDPTTADIRLFLLSSSGRIPSDTARGAGLAGTMTKPVRQSELYNCLIEGLQMSTATPGEAPSDDAEVVELGVVLLVEDNTMNQLVATRMLTKLGYRSDVASNGQEAIAALVVGEYDAVLMDCQMPVMDGYEATRQIRRAEAATGRRLPIIAMTAAAMQGDREACLDAGMDDYITKPIRIETIAGVLSRWIVAPATQFAETADSERAPALEPVIDVERFAILRDLDAGDGELLSALVNEYITDGTRLLAVLHESLAEGDPQAIERTAHTLKGSSANLGAVRVAEICGRLEALGRANALGTAPRLLADADTAFTDVRAALAVEVSEA